MSKEPTYALIYWYWDDIGDSPATFEMGFEFVTEKELEDITKLMADWHIKRWVTDPNKITAENYKDGDGALVELRNVTVKPVKVVQSWSYQPERIVR